MHRDTSLAGTGLLVGAWCWLERDLHRRLGEAVPALTSPREKVFVASASMAHGWRAAIWERLLPFGSGLPVPRDLIRPPLAELDRALGESLAKGSDAPGGTGGAQAPIVENLVRSLYPLMLADYEARAGDNSVGGGPLQLALRRCLDDLRALVPAGEAVLHATVGSTRKPSSSA